jgi:aminopeptidase N
MLLRSTAVAVGAAIATLVSVLGASPSVGAPSVEDGPYDAGLSTPQEDSYYPAKGDPGVDALHYDLRLNWHPARRLLRARAVIDLRATQDADRLRLDLGRTLQVRAVRVDGSAVPFTHERKTLLVLAPVSADGRYRVTIRYQGRPRPVPAPSYRGDMVDGLGWHTERDGQVWAMQEPFGAFTWYPVNDQPSDKALYDVRITAPRPFVGVSNGRLVDRADTERRTSRAFADADPVASYLMTVAIGPYRRHTQTGPHGLPITYWVPRGHRELLRPLRRTPGSIRFLESMFGPYPFDRAGVVVVPADSAMETQTMVTLGRSYYARGPRGVRETVLHELAHAWYGDTITPRDWSDLWMNEGMAMYAEMRWTVARGWQTWRQWRGEFTDPFWRSAFGPPGAYDRRDFGQVNVYYCTAAMWDALRTKVGNQRFAELIADWPQQHRDDNASRAELVAWFEAETGLELSDFFHRWLTARRNPA